MKGEISEAAFRAAVEENRRNWRQGLGLSRDGYVVVWQETRWYREVPYVVALIRYYSLNDPNAVGLTKSGRHAVLEHDDELSNVLIKCKEEGRHNWLYNDTMHDYAAEWTDERMVNEMDSQAIRDIDWILDEASEETKQALQEKLDKIKARICEDERLKIEPSRWDL